MDSRTLGILVRMRYSRLGMKFTPTCGTLNARTLPVVLLAALVQARVLLCVVSSAPNVAIGTFIHDVHWAVV